MSQRNSEYVRKERDLYETPAWVTEALIPHIPSYVKTIWEPAAGSGKMVDVLRCHDRYAVAATDIRNLNLAFGCDFLKSTSPSGSDAIITNPPYTHAPEFVRHALILTQGSRGFVAMLLRSDFDHAVTRRDLFSNKSRSPFSMKVVLTRRIVWFEREDGVRPAPSENHAWFCWDWRHVGPPTIAYERGKNV